MAFIDEVACDSQSAALGPVSGGQVCLPGSKYPRRTKVTMQPLPTNLQTMPDPCAGVPANSWCPGQERIAGSSTSVR